MRHRIRRAISYILVSGVLLSGLPSADTFASEVSENDVAGIHADWQDTHLMWDRRIPEDITDAEYFTRNLGMNLVTRQSVMRTIEDNWNDGLKYGEAAYHVNHADPAGCVNYGSRQYVGRENGNCGYNCTGFAASVLYYANGGSREDALSNMKEIYRPLYTKTVAFSDGTGWYYYIADGYDGRRGKNGETIPKSKVYYMGEARDPEALQTVLTEAEKKGKLKEGYILYFWPSTGWDCHFGIYAGRDSAGIHQMYHAAGRGNHNGVRLEKPIDLTQATSEGASHVYIIPLPEVEPGLQVIDGKKYFFYPDGRMERNLLFGMYFYDKNGVCTELWTRLGG